MNLSPQDESRPNDFDDQLQFSHKNFPNETSSSSSSTTLSSSAASSLASAINPGTPPPFTQTKIDMSLHNQQSLLDNSNNMNLFDDFMEQIAAISSANAHSNYSNLASGASVAASHESNTCQPLKIKTKSIEATLLPLVNQISILVNFGDKNNSITPRSSMIYYSDRAANALLRVGESLHLAIERFVNVGEMIAYENPTIKLEMLEACRKARESGLAIRNSTKSPNSVANILGLTSNTPEKLDMIQATNILLDSITRVLLLADVVIVNQILNSKNKVLSTLYKLENVIDVNNFMKLFKKYGSDLVELAYLSGERQNDLKDDKRRLQLSSSRWILEKSTTMILSTIKVSLKHTDCECAKENVTLLYSFLHKALDTLHYVIVDSSSMYDYSSPVYNNSMFKTSMVQASFTAAHRQFESTLDLVQNNIFNGSSDSLIINSLNHLIDSTQDFTDSLFICNDQRERIIRLQNEIREQTLIYLKEGKTAMGRSPYKLSPILNDCDVLKRLLQAQTMQLANNLFRENQDAALLASIKQYSASNEYELLMETLDRFKEYTDYVLELCKLLRHISILDLFEVTCEHHYNVFDNFSKMIQASAGTAALFPDCKSSTENLDLYCASWENQINDLSILVKEMQEFLNGEKTSKSTYLSLPRPGKHGSNPRANSGSRSNRLDASEQAKMAKLGLEMKLITSEMEAKAEKWNLPENEIIKVAKLMSSVAYNMHLFTRGEGSLRTVNDLFRKAEQFLQYGVIFFNIMKDFIAQIPDDLCKMELVNLAEKLPDSFQSLRNKLKLVATTRSATFNKADCVIQDTRDFMNLVSKLVHKSCICGSKYKINYDQLNTNIIGNLEPTSLHVPSQVGGLTSLDDSALLSVPMYGVGAFGNIRAGGGVRMQGNRSDSCGPAI